MMPKLLLILLLMVAVEAKAQQTITTFVLIRHAEKDLTQSTNDPDLAPEGKQRATKLAEVFAESEVTAVYSTPYKRTRQTVIELASRKNLPVNTYDANSEADIDKMLAEHRGGTIVVTGHSNTIPWFANKLIGMEKYRPLEDGDYNNLWIISVVEKGKVAKLMWLNY
jgi:2,3-bisphosphoglycerate-dependent phosphoglycerate mutase